MALPNSSTTNQVPPALASFGYIIFVRIIFFKVFRIPAWAVLVSHSFALVGELEPGHQLNASLGSMGVLVFFSVSGLLIRRSWEYDPSPRDFWIKRALRLLPALAVVGVVTAFVLGPLVTSVGLRTYFGSWETWISIGTPPSCCSRCPTRIATGRYARLRRMAPALGN